MRWFQRVASFFGFGGGSVKVASATMPGPRKRGSGSSRGRGPATMNSSFIARLDEVEDEILDDMEMALSDAVEATIRDAQETCPYDTGFLYESLEVRINGNVVNWGAIPPVQPGARIELHYKAPYAAYVHHHQPWLADALDGFNDHLAEAVASRGGG